MRRNETHAALLTVGGCWRSRGGASAARRLAAPSVLVGGADPVGLDRVEPQPVGLAVAGEDQIVALDGPAAAARVGDEAAVGAKLHRHLAVAGIGPAADETRVDEASRGARGDRVGVL